MPASPKPAPAPDPQSLLEACAYQLLADLLRSGHVPVPLTASLSAAGWSISISVTPQITAPPALTPCQEDVLAVLSPMVRMTTPRVLAALEEAGKIHGERTVGGALADLVREGRVLSSKKAPRGYYLPSQLQLFT